MSDDRRDRLATFAARLLESAAFALEHDYKRSGHRRSKRRREADAVGTLRAALQMAGYAQRLDLKVRAREALAALGRDGRGHRLRREDAGLPGELQAAAVGP